MSELITGGNGVTNRLLRVFGPRVGCQQGVSELVVQCAQCWQRIHAAGPQRSLQAQFLKKHCSLGFQTGTRGFFVGAAAG